MDRKDAMNMRRAFGSIVGLAFLACAPDDVVKAPLDEVCGEAGPVRLLALDEDESSLIDGPIVQRIDDALYFGIGRRAADGELLPPELLEERVVTTGLCGENPREIAVGVAWVFVHPWWPGRLLAAASDSRDFYEIDPEGEQAPRLIWTHGDAMHTEVTGGWVGIVTLSPQSTTATLVRFRDPVEEGVPPDPPTTLLAGVQPGFSSLSAEGEDILVLTTDTRLVEVDLETGEATTIAENVDNFRVPGDRSQIVIVRAPAEDGPTAGWPVSVLERASGMETAVGEARMSTIAVREHEISYRTTDDSGSHQRFVALPGLEIHDVDPNLTIVGQADARDIVEVDGELGLYDRATRQTTVVLPWLGDTSVEGDDLLAVKAVTDHRTTGEMWRIPLSTLAPVRIAKRASAWAFRTTDGSIVTPVDMHGEGVGIVGTIVVVDPVTLAEQVVDENAVVLSGFRSLFHDEHYGEKTLAYEVHDGERSGVWLAKLAADE